MEWQPIETAPEGKRVLVAVAEIPTCRLFIALKTNLGLWLAEDMLPMPYPPSHWMALPEKPKP